MNNGCIRLYANCDMIASVTCSSEQDVIEITTPSEYGITIQEECESAISAVQCVAEAIMNITMQESSSNIDIYTSIYCPYTIGVRSFSYAFNLDFES